MASQKRDSDRYASAPASLQPCPTFHSPEFDRVDEILYLVENTSDVTLTDFIRCHILWQLPHDLQPPFPRDRRVGDGGTLKVT